MKTKKPLRRSEGREIQFSTETVHMGRVFGTQTLIQVILFLPPRLPPAPNQSYILTSLPGAPHLIKVTDLSPFS